MANPLQQAAVRRKVLYVAGILALFTVSIVWRGKVPIPLSDERRVRLLQVTSNLRGAEKDRFVSRVERGEEREFFPDGPPAPAPTGVNAAADWFARHTIEGQAAPTALDLRELDQGDPEIAGTALRLGLIGGRGVLVTALWKYAIDQQKRNEFQEFEATVRFLTRLQPNFITPWIFQSWNLAYNVSVENDRLNDMYFYISRGIELLAEGERLNKKSPDMRFQLAFYYQNKFGVSDKVNTLRSLCQLSCIPPDDRDPKKRFRKPDGTLDMGQFQEFVRKNPQLVRRLREKLRLRMPDEIVQFLEDNYRVPSRYDRETGRLADARNQFPVLPPQFVPDEYSPRSENIDDAFDPFHAARAWYEYSLTVVPPPSGEPVGIVRLSGEDQLKYRVPKAPALIIFRQGAPRAQSYLAERLAKEGWFDTDTKWYPDERADTEEERWFPRAGGADAGRGEGLQAGTSSYAEWRRAYERWKRHGEQNGLMLDVAKRAQYERDAQGVPGDYYLSERTDEQLAKMGFTRAQVNARMALRSYELNRHMTNFPYFLVASEAEADRETVAARALLWEAERTVAENKPRAIKLYAEAIAKWRAVLVNYPRFHHPDNTSDRTEEETYEYYLALVGLLEKSERIESRVRRVLAAARALGPVDEDRLKVPLAAALADQEAGYLVAAADERVKRRLAELKVTDSQDPTQIMAYFDNPATREMVRKEFDWLPEYKTKPESKDDAERWVSPPVKQMVRERLGFARTTNTVSRPPAPSDAAGGQDPAAQPPGGGR